MRNSVHSRICPWLADLSGSRVVASPSICKEKLPLEKLLTWLTKLVITVSVGVRVQLPMISVSNVKSIYE